MFCATLIVSNKKERRRSKDAKGKTNTNFSIMGRKKWTYLK